MMRTRGMISVLTICTCSLLWTSKAAVLVVPSQTHKTINSAMTASNKGDTIRVLDGVYKESVFLTPGVTLISSHLFGSVLDGGGRGTIVTMGTNSTLSGFEVRNGTIGVFSTSSQTTISQCRITNNLQTGIMCVGNLPKIEDNLVVFNKGSGIQGWDVRTTAASINHNTIAFNSNHGVSLGGNSSIVLENNIIAFNDQFGVKPGDEAVRIEMINNCFYQNMKFSAALPGDNVSYDPLFADAKRMNFSLMKESRCLNLGTDNQNLGARISY